MSINIVADGGHVWTLGIYNNSTDALLTNGNTESVDLGTNGSPAWYDFDFGTDPTVSAIDYLLVGAQGTSFSNDKFTFDTSGGTDREDTNTGSTLPDPFVEANNGSNLYSIYVTFTADAGTRRIWQTNPI